MKTLLVVVLLLSSLALAGGDEPVKDEPLTKEQLAVTERVQTTLLTPLKVAEQERSAYSRARMPPRERRVRVTQTTASVDASSRPFFPFLVDVRFGSGWKNGDVAGCVYPESGEVFVKRGDTWRPAAFLTGKKSDPVKGVCEAGELAAK